MSLLLYLFGLVVSALWLRARPVRTAGRALLFWGIGILLLRVVGGVWATLVPVRWDLLAVVPGVLRWIGALLLLQAIWFLVHVERGGGRRLLWFRGLFAASLLLPAVVPEAAPAFLMLAAPLLFSFRWRRSLGAGALLLVSVVAVLTVLLGALQFGPASDLAPREVPGFRRFASQVTLLAVLYALFSVPMTASRIHLSVRRIDRRLVLSHLLAAVIPFILGVLFLLVSSALFLSTYRSLLGVRVLREASETARAEIASRVESGAPPPARPFGTQVEHQALVWRDAGGIVHVEGDVVTALADSLLAREESSDEAPLLWDGYDLWLRARHDGTGGVRVEALAQVDSLWLARVSRTVGESVRVFPGLVVETRGGGLRIGTEEERIRDMGLPVPGSAADSAAVRRLMRPIGPPRAAGFRVPGGATLECLFVSEAGWSTRTVPLVSAAGVGEQVASLLGSARENPFVVAVIVVLGIIAFLFLGTITVVSGMVLGMGRTVTRAVQALTEGTRALRSGNLDHRIPVEGNDELWRVADSFNEMAEGLGKIRSMELEQERVGEELRLARDIQNRLLPAAPPHSDRLELAGLSLPAREVGGDYYDYVLLEDGRIVLAVADVSGKGAPAALLMSAFRASLRSQDLATMGPAEALGRINRFIHESVDPGRFVTAFLALVDPATGDVRYANAGHDAPLALRTDGSIQELTGGGLILGILPQIAYEEAQARLEPGATLAVFTDGVTEAQSLAGEFFGPEGLVAVLRAGGQDSCPRILERLVTEIERFAGDAPQADDITVILARRR